MSARCPTCRHGTSGCILSKREWKLLRSVIVEDIALCLEYNCEDEAAEKQELLEKLFPESEEEEEG